MTCFTQPIFRRECFHVYLKIFYTYICIYIYIYKERETETERQKTDTERESGKRECDKTVYDDHN